MHWNGEEFRHEDWLDILGYQSGHGDDNATLNWLVCGPPATDWKTPPPRVFINLEPPYENHISYQTKQRISAAMARRALYWSLLVSPTAGVTPADMVSGGGMMAHPRRSPTRIQASRFRGKKHF